MSDFDSALPGEGSKRPALPAGDYPELAIEDVTTFDSKSPNNPGQFFRANLTVLDGGPAKRGTGGAFLEQMSGHRYPDHKIKAFGLIKLLIGALFGLDDKDVIQAQVNSAVLTQVTGTANPMRGHVFGARITNVTTKNGAVINKFENIRPVLDANGKPKRVDLGAAPAPVASAPTPPAIKPPPAPGANVAFPPAGWTAHPDAPGYFYQGQTVLTEAQLRAKV